MSTRVDEIVWDELVANQQHYDQQVEKYLEWQRTRETVDVSTPEKHAEFETQSKIQEMNW